MSEVKIGGDRLGSGNKMKAHLRNFERSTHDLSYLWKSTMSAGTLVPFMSEIALPGDTFDIMLDADVMTHPTIGPLFGNYKMQLDVFQVPMRLYQAKLHMNMLGIGMDMSKVKLPQVNLFGASIGNKPLNISIDNWHTNPSSILAYLGVRGTGYSKTEPSNSFFRQFNAVPYLGYWDIYKNYYANKQEEIGVVIHSAVVSNIVVTSTEIDGVVLTDVPSANPITGSTQVVVFYTGTDQIDSSKILWDIDEDQNSLETKQISQFFYDVDFNTAGQITFFNPRGIWPDAMMTEGSYNVAVDGDIELTQFPLENIDLMRQELLGFISDSSFVINSATNAPYGLPFQYLPDESAASIRMSQEGLGIKTYNSDLFNNWISTEWIDGADGISAVTAIDTSDGNFTIDELNLSKKVYNMLNRIALSGGSYDDWLDAVYTHDRQRSAESPIYLGGMMQTLGFQEVVSTSDTRLGNEGIDTITKGEALGSLAGRGKLSNNKKGGKIIVKVDEPSYLLAICSLTPKIDYSQGNKWDMSLGSLDDLHKPSLDQIGFQDLVTDQMAYWDTEKDEVSNLPIFKSAGKQPAWLNYMTNVPMTRGNFAIPDNQMFMTLNRKFDMEGGQIKDLTTYVDPAKFNNIFSDTAIDAQNFWVQIAVNITARRKMSAKIIPNL